MTMETPKNYDKKGDYASPIGLLQNYNSASLGRDQVPVSHEEEFYRIKANRLEAELLEAKGENSILKAKATDHLTTIQMLRQRILVLQNETERMGRRSSPSFVTDSNFNSGRTSLLASPSNESKMQSGNSTIMDKTQRNAINSQLERLVKQNRILKNEHEIQLSKLTDENKKLQRKISELENANSGRKTERQLFKEKGDQESIRSKYEEKIAKMEKTSHQLREQSTKYFDEKRIAEQKCKSQDEILKQLRKENEEMKVIISSHSRATGTIEELQQKNEKLNKEIQGLLAELEGTKGIGMGKSRTQQLDFHHESRQASRIISQRNSEEDITQLQRSITQMKRKLQKSEDALAEKDEQLKNILTKLRPLLAKDGSKAVTQYQKDPANSSRRASLSMLQVFLQKYKINAF